jgi:diguanylate cyclase (GGDEF)-like protein/PAS domain S-box-containing protein
MSEVPDPVPPDVSVPIPDSSPELFCVLRRDGIMAMRNEAWARFLGYSPEEFVSLSFFDLLHPDDRDRIIPPDDPSCERSLTLAINGRVRCADGAYRQVAWTILPAREPGVIYALGHDPAESSATEALTAELERLHNDIDILAAMRDNLDLCVTMQEACHVIRRFCHEAMGGWPGEVWICNPSRNLLERIARWGDGDEDLMSTMEPADCWGMRGGRPHSYDPKGSGLPCKHHKVVPRRSICMPLKGASDVVGLLTTWGTSEDSDPGWHSYLRRTATIAEVLAMGLANLTLRESLRSQSIRDPLTSLFNRRFMEESFDRELARAVRHESTVGLIVLDLDNFKRFNDEFGHRAGDTALIEVGSVLRDSIRTEDIACRYGGEEFAVIMPGAPLEAVVRRAGSLASAVREISVRELGGKILGPLTVSMGVALYPDHGDTREALITAADDALYAAKSGGRDCVRVATAAHTHPESAQADW